MADPNNCSIIFDFLQGPLSNFISAVVGAFIGGGLAWFGTIFAVKQTYKNDLKKREVEQKEQLRGFYKALKTEMTSLWESYMWGIGNDIEKLPDGSGIERYYPVTQEYFITFRANAHLIGHVQNDELRALMIKTYIKAQGLIDAYRLNNRFNEEYEQWAWTSGKTQNSQDIEHANAMKKCIIEYAAAIKELHNELKSLVPVLCKSLEENYL